MSKLKKIKNKKFVPSEYSCSNCGSDSNKMCWVNGICENCRDKPLKGKKTIEITKPILIFFSFCMFPIAIIEIILNLFSLGFYNKISKKSLTAKLGSYIAKKQLEL